MRARFLQPLVLQETHWQFIEREINNIFYESIFKKLFEISKKFGKEITNSLSENHIADAIKSGKIYYQAGEIKGDFNAKISKSLLDIGGKYNGRTKAWTLPFLPAEVQIAIAQTKSIIEKMQRDFIATLDDVSIERELENPQLSLAFDKSLKRLDDSFQSVVKKIAIPPKFTEQAAKAISESWANNLKLYIKGWADESILKLRQQIQANTMQGGRAESMVKSIMAEYGVSRRKAKFLARQETSLLMSKFQEERFKDVGISKYRWSTSHDERVRHDHKVLNGKIYRWDQPPITNRESGARNNPGQDFGCRCVAIPIAESAL